MNFASDNTAPASPEILRALAAANSGAVKSYGADALTAQVRDQIAAIFGHPGAVVHLVATGTAANTLALACMVHPYGAILCAEEAHIAADECGAPEFYTGGAKLITLPSRDGKITPAQIHAVMARAADGGVHHVLPEAVSITQATEWGTVYTPGEVAALGEACHRHGLFLHMDGARFANALVHLGCAPADLTWRAGVHALSFGATKNGALAAEAVVFFHPDLAHGFERRRKRAGQLWSKFRYLSAQMGAYLADELWLRNATHANAMATRLAAGLAQVTGVSLVQPVQANEIFAAMPDALIEALQQQGAAFYRWIGVQDSPLPVVRLVTAFSTTPEEVDTFLRLCGELAV